MDIGEGQAPLLFIRGLNVEKAPVATVPRGIDDGGSKPIPLLYFCLAAPTN